MVYRRKEVTIAFEKLGEFLNLPSDMKVQNVYVDWSRNMLHISVVSPNFDRVELGHETPQLALEF